LKDGKTALEYLEAAIRYLSATAKDISDEQMKAALEAAFKDDGGSIMGGFVEKWIEKGKQEGLQEGMQLGKQEGQQALRNAIIDLLLLRFDATPTSIIEGLENISDLETLRQLNRQAATAESLTNFEQYLASLNK
jgi:flagellar biosynthesis/type III secretory pathway protein FliH